MRYLNLAGYVAIPIAFLVHLWLGKGKTWEPTATFVLAALGVIPLAHLMGEATEHLSVRTGPTWGGLLNATFGNAAELIIAVIALAKGLNEIVKASLTGSILGNLLLVAGAAMVVGGWNREKQLFSRANAESSSGLLLLSVAAMLFPAIFHHSFQLTDPQGACCACGRSRARSARRSLRPRRRARHHREAAPDSCSRSSAPGRSLRRTVWRRRE